jgi:hypothetical protein
MDDFLRRANIFRPDAKLTDAECQALAAVRQAVVFLHKNPEPLREELVRRAGAALAPGR